ncbi:MAG: peptidase S8 [Flavobacteriales bacterium CG_4_10_14_0_2_um_filter_32_8]|nr:MAG: peptidase S8 [Flavobacteriales bacterium CG_4_10_14_0_2_um_filter_32_8]
MKKLSNFLLFIFLIPISIFGQTASVSELDQNFLNWHSKDLQTDAKVGTGINKAYSDFLKGKKAKKTVVVAVIDSGVDIEHKDIKKNIWVNPKEIADNNIDDDNNGYIDDVHGWNFLGNSAGENISSENMECTRILKLKNVKDPNYKKAKLIYDRELEKAKKESDQVNKYIEVISNCKLIIKNYTGVEVSSIDDLAKVNTPQKDVALAKEYLTQLYSVGLNENSLKEYKEHNDSYLKYYLNLDFNPRAIVGDNPTDLNDKNYGNSNVYGPFANHGTSVAGVIAAIRDNNEGINGVTNDVKIMVLRAVPNGDERDKDIALAIMYAVDNGADIINMSFGKAISPQKEFIDKAIKYAEEKNVLIVQAAGNDGKNIDVNANFPSKIYNDKTVASNLLLVGASSPQLDENIAASFSNYGAQVVDLFAPGVNIISLDTNNTYSMSDGTSVASPVAAGIAALILSYYPDLKPNQLISLLKENSYKVTQPKKVLTPNETGKKSKIKFSKLSKSGGIINAYNALLAAEKLNKN